MSKMSKLEKQQWDTLYEYIKNEILKYEKTMKLPKKLILRLIGLHEGKFMANNKIKPMAQYGYDVILLTFKLNKFDIINALSDKSKFKDESHMINYMMAIIESKINDTVLRLETVKTSSDKCKNIEISESQNKAEYKKKTKKVTNSKLKDLF